MRRGPDRLNTTVHSVVALLLIGVGAYGLARGYGALGDARAMDPILTDDVRDFVSDNAGWFWPLAAAVSLLIAWLGLRWLVAQVHNPTVSRLPVRADGPGRTELVASGATTALAQDIAAYPGVRGAQARMTDDDPSPEVDVKVEVSDDADVVAVRSRIEEHALPRFKAALELQELRSTVHLRLAEPAGRSVR